MFIASLIVHRFPSFLASKEALKVRALTAERYAAAMRGLLASRGERFGTGKASGVAALEGSLKDVELEEMAKEEDRSPSPAQAASVSTSPRRQRHDDDVSVSNSVVMAPPEKGIRGGVVSRSSRKMTVDYIKEHRRKGMFLIAVQVTFFFLFQSISVTTFQLFDCVEVAGKHGTERYLRTDMRVSCKSSFYNDFRWYVDFVAVCISVIFPLIAIIGIGVAKKTYSSRNFRLYVAVMTYGIQSTRFFWQGLLLFRRVICISIIVFFSHPIDMYFFVWVITLSLATQYYLSPFEMDIHNNQEITALFTLVIIGNIGYVFRAVDSEILKIVLAVLIVVLEGATICYFMWSLVVRTGIAVYKDRRAAAMERINVVDNVPTRREIITDLVEQERAEAAAKEAQEAQKQLKYRRRLAGSPASDSSGGGTPQFSTGAGFDQVGTGNVFFSPSPSPTNNNEVDYTAPSKGFGRSQHNELDEIELKEDDDDGDNDEVEEAYSTVGAALNATTTSVGGASGSGTSSQTSPASPPLPRMESVTSPTDRVSSSSSGAPTSSTTTSRQNYNNSRTSSRVNDRGPASVPRNRSSTMATNYNHHYHGDTGAGGGHVRPPLVEQALSQLRNARRRQYMMEDDDDESDLDL